ncbi:MAG: NADPH-dependent assimilatory sulfite reductase hemoprotein subunit [Planctomycetes bacterium]|nr:NADPH-dependent assimilatory sulfite reductase hemoprotein subunit [Planctomycetota bacterium]
MSIEQNPSPPPKRSAVELIKENSQQIRGGIAEELARDTERFNDQDKQLIKFHGFYQQDNRDARKDRHREGAGKAFQFMVRCKIPGGKVTAEQYLTIDRLAGAHANGTIRITSRQGFQLHGVLKGDLKQTIGAINQSLLTTLGACGDVNRNVMAPPAPVATPVYRQLQEHADVIARHFAPRTTAYHEIWVDGTAMTPTPGADARGSPELVDEPIYGKLYLPRKFKVAFALPDDNSTDLFAQDLGFLADVKDGAIVGYNVHAGGGMGMTHGNANTFPHIAQAVCYVTPDQFLAAGEGVIKLFRDHGNRADRKRARLKYVLHDWGIDRFRDVLQTYLPFPIVPPKDIPVTGFPLHLGWHEQGDGNYYYGISIENGRIKDEGDFRLRTAMRKLVEKTRPSIRLTPMQDILLCDLPKSAKPLINRLLTVYGIAKPDRLSLVQTHSMACPAIPTCGLALSEAERVMPALIDQLEVEIRRLGLGQEKISIRMTGCPNGCVRPYQSDIGIVGRSGDKYTLFVGGNLVGSRLSFVLKDLVPIDQIVSTLAPVLDDFKRDRQPDEGFGDYCQRAVRGSASAPAVS